MKSKKYLIVLFVFLISIVSFSHGKEFQKFNDMRVFLAEEIQLFNGQNSLPGYIVVENTVYDISKSKAWRNGTHNGVKASNDVTDFIKKAPHGDKVLKKLPVVGLVLKGITQEELSKNNGKNGSNSYVAVDGLVYDMSNEKAWKSGKHGGQMAGQDITDFIKNAKHGSKVLTKEKLIGKLITNFSKAELLKYNGQNGMDAYVALNGVIYEVHWKNGMHNGAKAGNDITNLIKKSPHGLKVLADNKVIGLLK